ncbi:hypothetical protein FIV42_18155 [Persicimonas caeni]|jgi:hypothetical protein|uniref:Uncharacterized protein n=1 Tax=Persicimonas caeni TaxID=2292766 RepID=A0A4Y6PWS8_PERCE|nr:hypothetical protein [Persicimonas caeni]QDG52589.1 hypothetical protein FIV42_18155 [Persicimonas caeni]QED33811.1 hypothetical protein FRD00_18150 [Persicimonas caeni]
MKGSQGSIQSTSNLLNYFREELKAAFDAIGVDSTENTEAYLVHLLENFVRLDPQLAQEVGFQKPAAFLLGDAMNAPGEQRIVAYRRLGDVSLFNCGFFDAHLTRRGTVSSQYYRNVGRIAYGQLSDLMMFKDPGGLFQQIYEELADKFDGFVEAFKCLGRPKKAQKGRDPSPVLQKLRRGESLDLSDLKSAGLVPQSTKKKKD